MGIERTLTGAGAGVATCLLVAILVMELLYIEFAALVGLLVGVLAGIGVFAGLWRTFPDLTANVSRAVTAYAAFGFTLLFLLALSALDIGQNVLTVDVMAGLGLFVAAVVFLLLWVNERGSRV